MRIFLLEDSINRERLIREALFPRHEVFDGETFAEGIWVFRNNKPFDLLLLDHDLGAGANGADFCQWLVKEHTPIRTIIHSYNPDGARRMWETLRDADWLRDVSVELRPFGLGVLDELRRI